MDSVLSQSFRTLLCLSLAHCSVILSGGPYCSTDGDPVLYAEPGTTVSINCVVDNPDNVLNLLVWRILSFGDETSVINVDGADQSNTVNEIVFTSFVNDAEATERTTNATLSFLADSRLDEATIKCQDNSVPLVSRNCTLFVLTPPSTPTSLMCTNRTIDSLTLQWGEPTDNGGEDVLQYNITGTPGDISIVESGNKVIANNLLPNTTYTFGFKAGNSVGLGLESSLECTTKGKRPPIFDSVMVCADVSDTYPDSAAELIVIYLPCPLVTDELTPEVMSYRVVVGGSDIPVNDSSSCNFVADIPKKEWSAAYTVDVYANNSLGSSKTSYNNATFFYASWLRDVRVTNVIGSSAVLQYTTVDCVLSSDLIVQLIIPNCTTVIDGDTTHHYKNGTTSSFLFTALAPSDTIMFTLQVALNFIILYSTTGSFTVVPTSGGSSTVFTSNSVSQTCQCSPACVNSGLSSSVTAGLSLAIGVPVTAVITALLTLLFMYLCFHHKKDKLKLKTTSSETSFSVKTTDLEMKGNEAYGQVNYGHTASPAVLYDTVNQ